MFISKRRTRYLYLWLILGIGLISGCATLPAGPPSTYTKPVSSTYQLKDLCRRYDVRWQWDSVAQVVTLYNASSQAKVMVGSGVVLFDGEKILLDKPILLEQGTIVVSNEFKVNIMERFRTETPATSSASYRIAKAKTIIIDAGHGGKDPGAIGISGVHEKEIVLDVARRLTKILSKRGFKVVTTRDSDEFISLRQRAEIAGKSKADLFISIHANTSPSRAVSGLEVFALKDLTYGEKVEAEREEVMRKLFSRLNIKQRDHATDEIVADLMYAHKQMESEKLAKLIVSRASRFLRARNRGVKESRFYVLRNTFVPAVLVEIGFLSNSKEERLLKTSGYRQRIAFGLAKGISEYVAQ